MRRRCWRGAREALARTLARAHAAAPRLPLTAGPLTYGQVTAAIYMQVSLADFATLFAARATSCAFRVQGLPVLRASFAADEQAARFDALLTSSFLPTLSAQSASPSVYLLLAAVGALGASTALTSQWPTSLNEKRLAAKFFSARGVDGAAFDAIQAHTGTRMEGAPNAVLGTTWLYVLVWFVAQDLIKARRRNVRYCGGPMSSLTPHAPLPLPALAPRCCSTACWTSSTFSATRRRGW